MKFENIDNIHNLLKRTGFKSEDFKSFSEAIEQLIIVSACSEPTGTVHESDDQCLREFMKEAKKASEFLACFSSAVYE